MKPGGPLKRNTVLARRTPLVARTPLQTTTRLARIIPLRAVGAMSKRRRPLYEQCKVELFKRAAGRCEINGVATVLPDPHHAFGRSLGVPGGAAWCNVPEMMLAVCRECHEKWHDEKLWGVAVKDHWRWECLRRLAARYDAYFHGTGLPSRVGPDGLPWSVRMCARYMVGVLVRFQVEPTP